MSFVSLFEIGEILIQLFYVVWEKKSKKSTKKSHSQCDSNQDSMDLEAFLKENSTSTNPTEFRGKICVAVSDLLFRIKQLEAEKSAKSTMYDAE